jgi:hypothetical protein
MEGNTVVAPSQQSLPPEVVETVVIGGDLADLNAAQRAEYYGAVCRSLGLNPLTKPFEYLTLNGKLRLYALRDCADQLRRLHAISIYIANRERMSDIYVVTARAKDRHGREDESTGAVTVGALRGDALANALMKAETKAKRRVTLSIAGLGWLDETELDTIPQSRPVVAPDQESPEEGHPTADQISSLIEDETELDTIPQSRPVVAPDQESPEEGHPTADQISSLIEMARSCGVDLTSFGDHMRRLMQLAEETKITKKFLRESMTMAQFEVAWQHYSETLKKLVEEQVVADDVLDYPSPDDAASLGESEAITSLTAEGQQTDLSELASSSEARSDDTYATPQQIAGLKRLAQQVGDDAYVDVQDTLDRHPEGLVIGMYEIVKQRLQARKAGKKGEVSGKR